MKKLINRIKGNQTVKAKTEANKSVTIIDPKSTA